MVKELKPRIVFCDEFVCYEDNTPDFSWLAELCREGVHAIVCVKPRNYGGGELTITPPSSPDIVVGHLRTPHRQGCQPYRLGQYWTTHRGVAG